MEFEECLEDNINWNSDYVSSGKESNTPSRIQTEFEEWLQKDVKHRRLKERCKQALSRA